MAINNGKFPEKMGGCVSGLRTEGLAFCLRKETSLFITEKRGMAEVRELWDNSRAR